MALTHVAPRQWGLDRHQHHALALALAHVLVCIVVRMVLGGPRAGPPLGQAELHGGGSFPERTVGTLGLADCCLD